MPAPAPGHPFVRPTLLGASAFFLLIVGGAVFLSSTGQRLAPRAPTILSPASTIPSPLGDKLSLPIAAPILPDQPSAVSLLPADSCRAFLAVEAALHAPGSVDNDLETRLWRFLPELLDTGGARLVGQLLATCPAGSPRETLLRVCALAWPRLDPDAALAWAAQLPDAGERREARERVLASMVRTDPAKALDATRVLAGTDGADGSLAVQLVGAWADLDFRASRAWVLKLPPGNERDDCLARVATVQANRSPADAARFALKHLPPGPLLDETLVSAVYQWAGRDPAAARQWVEDFPDGPLRDRALQEVSGTAMTPAGRSPTPGLSLVPVGNAP